MSNALTVLQQVVVMFILAGAGYLLFRFGKITQEGSKAIANILIYLSLPCTIFNSFLVDKTPELMKGLAISTGLCFASVLIGALLSRLILGKRAIENFASTFANPGFFGIPILAASFSQNAVFFIAPYIAFVNLGQWTYGCGLLTAEKGGEKVSPFKGFFKKLITAPFMVGIVLGLIFFFTGLKMPSIPGKCINFIAGLNTPLAMFTIGIYLAQTNVLKIFIKGRLYLLSMVRLVLTPLAMLGILSLLPNDMIELKMAILIASACPVGSNVAVYAQLYDSDSAYAVETVVISTLLSIITIPAMVMLASFLWKVG